MRRLPAVTHGTESRGDLVGGGLHDADQRGDETHLHGALAAFDLCQLLKDVLSQGRHDGVCGGERRRGLREDNQPAKSTHLSTQDVLLWKV